MKHGHAVYVVMGSHFPGKTCAKPTPPLHGVVHFSEEEFYCGNVAIFTCEEGYEIFGETVLECRPDGSLSSSLPVCLQGEFSCVAGHSRCPSFLFRQRIFWIVQLISLEFCTKLVPFK